jgi:hypothetical protein
MRGPADSDVKVTSDPVGIIRSEALRARHAPEGRFLRPQGRTWSLDPRGSRKRAGWPARRVGHV